MANINPTQTCTISPYSSYNSNIVNQLTRMITQGENCLHSSHAMDVAIDSTSPLTTLIVSTGQAYKDDVIVEFTESLTVDMEEADFYISGNPFNEAGYYLIVLDYTYVKAKPAPVASIQIIKPSQLDQFSDAYLLLKCVSVIHGDVTCEISELFDYLPSDTTVERKFTQAYVGLERTLPTWTLQDEGRLIYVVDEDELYYGTSARWETFSAVRDNMTTTSCAAGQLAYVHSTGVVLPAISSDPSTFADCAVLQVGTEISGNGKVRLFGKVEDVPIQTGITIAVGDKLYLSETVAGSVTNLISTPYDQSVGVCIALPSVTTCDIWFMPGGSGDGGGGGTPTESLYDRYQDLLLGSIYQKLFVDAFINTDYIDLTQTTAEVDVTHFEVDGDLGEMLVSTSLTDPGYDGTCIVSCQISAQMTNEDDILWYASNTGGLSWELTDLDIVHTFSTQEFATVPNLGTLSYGEWVVGSMSGKRALVRCIELTSTGVSDVTGTNEWLIGEILLGETSGNSVTITGATILNDDCIDLRVMAYFNDTAAIQDYGILYDVDLALDETSRNNELNIDTLYADMYEVPSQDNDGLRNYPFSDTTAIPILNIIGRFDTITAAIVKLDNDTGLGVGEFEEDDTTPSVSARYDTWLTCYDSTASLSITYLDDGYVGQKTTIIRNAGEPVTISHSANMRLQGSIDFVMGIYDSISLTFVSSVVRWVENCRSVK